MYVIKQSRLCHFEGPNDYIDKMHVYIPNQGGVNVAIHSPSTTIIQYKNGN